MAQENLFEQVNNPSFTEPAGLRAMVIGVGGAGISLVDGLRFDNFDMVENMVIDVDARALADSLSSSKLSFGRRHTRGMGTGGDLNLARRAIEEEKDKLRERLDGVDLVFLLAGLGGGTGGGVAPVVARLARDLGALVFAFAPMPFSWEKFRHAQAQESLEELRKHANAVVPLPNDSLLQIGGPDATALECFAEAGRNVSRGISAICSLIFKKGMIDVDFAHLRQAFGGRTGRTLFGYGKGKGKDGLREAMRELLVCPMLHLPEISKSADILLIFINGGPGLGMSALHATSEEIRNAFKAGDRVVFGAHVDENLGDEVRIMVLGAADMGTVSVVADVAPASDQLFVSTVQPKLSHPSRLKTKESKSTDSSQAKTGKKKDSQPLEQNTFPFMDAANQRGIFDDLPSRNMYEGEDLDVPAYLRRGVRVAI